MKPNKSYHFSVEGNCEKLYLDHLKNLINDNNSSKYNVVFHIKPNCSPQKYFKGSTPYVETYSHIWDREDDSNEIAFQNVLKSIKQQANKAKVIIAGYSHLAFELWIILHKELYTASANKRQYLQEINLLYDKEFKSHDALTKEDNFKQVLAQINLDDVISAISYAEQLRTQKQNFKCESRTFSLKKKNNVIYYTVNPDTYVHVIIKHILSECGLLK